MTGRIDVVSIFPDYLAPLELSLLGKARAKEALDIRVHDLRAWTTDRHRTVDDTPAGGGAGMVMRPDVWGEALDDVLEPGREAILVVPTPAGVPFSQPIAAELAARVGEGAQLVFACGRYEGIDARVAAHYAGRPGVSVRELSIGDYVLNGGEVAALAMIEAIGRLVPGVVGNPHSLVEESHGEAGLLEYPVYTQPPAWRDLEVPEVLRSGDHGRIAGWRRDRAVERTAAVRPDLIAAHPITVRRAKPGDAAALHEVARVTFPLACPPDFPMDQAHAFVEENLSTEAFRRYAKDRRRILLVAQVAGAVVGYTMSILTQPGDPDVAGALTLRPTVELSKVYVLPGHHGRGAAADLLAATLDAQAGTGAAGTWLAVNQRNERAQAFYAKHGFVRVGTRTFTVGTRVEDDYVLERPLP